MDFIKVGLATLAAAGFGLVSGYPTGLGIDSFEDAFDIQKSKRLPELVQKQTPNIKKGLAALVAASSVGAMGIIYYLNSLR